MRVGQGYDAHRFGPGDHIVLGGERIACEFAIEAHSDGDVLIHAICDALLGAAGLGDIGQHFPDNKCENYQRDSREFLREISVLLARAELRVGNIDATVILQAPKIADYLSNMSSHIAEDLSINPSQVNIKATTTEYMGFEGRKEGVSAMAIALLL